MHTDEAPPTAPARHTDIAGIVIAAALFVAAAVIFWDMTTLQITSTYGVGPKAMPIVVATGLALLAVGNLVLAVRGSLPERESAAARPVLLVLGGVVGLIAIFGLGGGFIPAGTVLFAATSAAFGRQPKLILLDIAIGFALSVVIFLLFDKLLTLSLPAGPLERLF
jgi:putative tricarboxylic transport membrane protein